MADGSPLTGCEVTMASCGRLPTVAEKRKFSSREMTETGSQRTGRQMEGSFCLVWGIRPPLVRCGCFRWKETVSRNVSLREALLLLTAGFHLMGAGWLTTLTKPA